MISIRGLRILLISLSAVSIIAGAANFAFKSTEWTKALNPEFIVYGQGTGCTSSGGGGNVVVLNPGYVGGTIQVGSETMNSASVFADSGTCNSITSISPNATSSTYNLTVNVPQGTTPTYNVSASVHVNNWRTFLGFPAQQTTVQASQTSPVDFILANPGYIHGTITANGGTLDYAYVTASSNSGNSYAYTYGSDGGTYQLPVFPDANTSLSVIVYFTDGSSVSVPQENVSIAAGDSLSRDYNVAPPAGAISGTIQHTGSALASHYISATGPNGVNSVTTSADGPYSFSNLADGSYNMSAYSQFGNCSFIDFLNCAYFYYPGGSFLPNRNPSVSGSATSTVNISAQQAILNGKITFTGSLPRADVNSTYTQAYSSDNDAFGAAPVSTSTGAYSIIAGPGTWTKRFLSTQLYNGNQAAYLNESLYFSDYQSQNSVTVAAGGTGTRDLSYGTGSVTITLQAPPNSNLTFSNPYLQGTCNKLDSNSQVQWGYDFWSYGNQVNTSTGSVQFFGMDATCTVTAYALVNGSNTSFGTLSVRVTPGVDFITEAGAPTLNVASPAPYYITSNSSIAVTGTASDSVNVSSITVNGTAATLASTNNPNDPNEVSFTATANLPVHGPNTITTVATNPGNYTSTDVRTVYRSDGPPNLSFSPADGTITTSTSVTVQGTVNDDSGVASITLNGQALSFQATGGANNEVSFSTQVTLPQGDTYLQVVVTDKSTQTTSQTHKVTVVLGTISGVSASGTYGGTATLQATLMAGTAGLPNKVISFTMNGQSAGTATTNNNGLATLSNVSLAGLAAGSYPAGVTATFASSSGTGNLVVNPRPVTVTADAQSKTYGDADPALTYQITAGSLVNGDTFAGTLVRAAGETVGNYPIRQGTLALSNNYAMTYKGANLKINKKAASVQPNPATKVYGSADPALSGTLSGFLTADNVTASYSRTAGQTVAGSPYTIRAVLSPSGVLANYNIQYNTAAFTITPAPLTVTADSASWYAAAFTNSFQTGSLTGSIVGVVSGDNITVTYTTTAVPGSLVGTYPIIPVLNAPNGVLSNYTITVTDGVLNVGMSSALYVTGTGCKAADFSGHAYTDSFDSSKGAYAATKSNDHGDISVVGNLRLSGDAVINGTVFALDTTVGDCDGDGRKDYAGIEISGKAHVTGGYSQLTPILFPIPGPFTAGTSDIDIDGTKDNQTLAPGSYGDIDVSGHGVLTLSPGVYYINSIKLHGGSKLQISSSGQVILNVAGIKTKHDDDDPDGDKDDDVPVKVDAKRMKKPIDFSGGSVNNPAGVPANLLIVYGGTGRIELSGDSDSYGLVYAPLARVKLSGKADWFGAMIVNTIKDSGGSAIHYDRRLGQ